MIWSLRFRKDVLILMLLCFGFCVFAFQAIPHPICYLISIVDKTHLGHVMASFSVQLLQLFSYAGGVLVIKQPTFFIVIDWCVLAIQQTNTRGAFVIIILICSNLLNCIRSVGAIVITECGKTASKSFSLSSSSQKPPFFTLYGHSRYFRFKRKYQHYGPCF